MLAEIGAGGMGVVYAAYDPELDRKVAIKLLRSGRGDGARAQARLRLEAQAMARINHPHVVSVHDVGVHDGEVYIAMEYIEGRTVAQWLDEAERSWTEVRDVFIQAAQGLAAAHAHGLLHRDVKPDNLMIDARGSVRVMDFGVARAARSTELSDDELVSSGSSTPVLVTRDGAMMGTLAYMGPERFAGAEVDERTDQFSFCVALWEGLFGERPHAGIDPRELAIAITRGERRKPPADRVVPLWLRQVVERGLSVEPGERWPTMEALAAALSRDPSRQRRRWIAAGAGLLVVSAGIFGAQRWEASRAQPCTGAAALLADAWDDTRRAEVRAAILGIDRPFAEAVWARTAPVLDDYAAAWTAMHNDACEATAVRGEQSPAVMDLRMACLHRAKVELAASCSTH